MDVYINAISSISYQQTFENKSLKGFAALNTDGENKSYEPVYKELLNPKRIRRLGRTIRMGLACATDCLKEAGVEKPDAILVGTGGGCIQDTYKFLSVLKENDEDILNPTPFIQSTHNTVAGQIALMIGCKEYNMTFTHNDLSFESAIIDGVSLLKDGAVSNAMIGGIDELTELQSELIARAGKLYDGIIGDGAGFFIVSSKKEQSSYARLSNIKIINANADEFNYKLEHYLQKNELSGDSIDLVLTNNESLFTNSS
ncbi:MAG: beta-ketoacyl synthase chain length factor, partial [Bacteroidales bacterium]|nr:beta-ketoacyl synthase chain length factor [Bacteroidales bacterium]